MEMVEFTPRMPSAPLARTMQWVMVELSVQTPAPALREAVTPRTDELGEMIPDAVQELILMASI